MALTFGELTDEQKEISWEKGDLLWKMHAGQWRLELAYVENTNKLFVGDCSRQLGKSTWAVIKSISTALIIPGARIRYATAFLTDLEQFIIPAFDLVTEDAPESVRPTYKAQKSTFWFPNGSHISLVGLDRKPNGLRGNNLDLIILDECRDISRLRYIYSSVLIPATTHKPHAKIVMISTQPDIPDHEFIEFCDEAEEAGGYIQLNVYENPRLTEDDIERLAKESGGKESTAFRREYLCERIVEEEKAIIPEFHVERHIVSQFKKTSANQFYHKLEAIDSGVRDMTAILFGYYDFVRGKLCIEDEVGIRGPEVTTRRIAELVRQKEKELNYGIVHSRIADNDNLILVQDLGREFELYFAPTNKDNLHAMVNKVRLWFQQDRVEISSTCIRLIGALKSGIWDKNRKEFDRHKIHGHYDMIAALVYMIRNVPDSVNPIPSYFGVRLDSQIVVPSNGLSDDAQTLKRAFMGR